MSKKVLNNKKLNDKERIESRGTDYRHTEIEIILYEKDQNDAIFVDGQRLDNYLTSTDWSSFKELKQFEDKFGKISKTRSYFQRLIKKGCVKVNGKYIEKASYIVRKNDKISVIFIIYDEPTNLIPQKIDLNIEYEDDSKLFVNKPSGMVVHPGAGNPTGTLANAVAYYFNKKSLDTFSEENEQNQEQSRRVGLAHRLDKDTSGGILIAKNRSFLELLMKQFSQRIINKYYVSIVESKKKIDFSKNEEMEKITLKNLEKKLSKFIEGNLSKNIDKNWVENGFSMIRTGISRNLKDRKKMVVTAFLNGPSVREAVTLYKVIGEVSIKPEFIDRPEGNHREKLKESPSYYYLVLLKPITGRLHQLRLHMQNVKFPILGDKIYGKQHPNLNFMFLHSLSLCFYEKFKNLKDLDEEKQICLFAKLPTNWGQAISEIQILPF